MAGTDSADGTLAVCESCGGDDDDLQPVWPASGAGDSAELWCGGCRDEFPHEVATDGEGDEDGQGEAG